jgi:predicted nucleotidyltransferase
MNNHGLSKRQLSIIRDILLPYKTNIERIALFGSRATGKFRDNSDIDLVIYGSLDKESQNSLFTAFKDSYLSIDVDVIVYSLIDNPRLKHHIDSHNQEFNIFAMLG